jgi:thioredoxin-like negative regulator of GroEL
MRTRSLGAALLVAAIAGAGCAPATSRPALADPEVRRGQSVEELIERGRAFAAIGDLTRGEQYLSAALRVGADVKRVLPMLLHVCVESGRYRAAEAYISEYEQKDPENTRLRLLHAMLEGAIGDRAAALREYQAILRAHPDEPAGHFALAVLLRDTMGDAGAAREHFLAYLRLAPDGEYAQEARASLTEDGP